MKQKTISLLTLQEWCDYWSEDNAQYLDDGRDVGGGDALTELREAASVMRTLLELVDGVNISEHGAPTFASVGGSNWFDVRESLTGKK